MRDVDRLIDHVRECEYIRGPIHKQVLVNRITVEPTAEELARAKEQVYGKTDSLLETRFTTTPTRVTVYDDNDHTRSILRVPLREVYEIHEQEAQ